jgi:hypothetical protein
MATVTPNLMELFEEAYERAGLVMRSGYDLKSIRRSLNILTLEWQNRGLNLWTIESGTETLVAGTATYTMPTDTIDLIEHQVRRGTGTSQVDHHLERSSVSTYAHQSQKNLQGRPTQIFVQRLSTSVTATMWPVPDTNEYTLFYYRLKGMDGLTSGADGSADMPPRFVPALVAGLAFHVAQKRPESSDRVPALRREYLEQFELAAGEDSDRDSLYLIPSVGGTYG